MPLVGYMVIRIKKTILQCDMFIRKHISPHIGCTICAISPQGCKTTYERAALRLRQLHTSPFTQKRGGTTLKTPHSPTRLLWETKTDKTRMYCKQIACIQDENLARATSFAVYCLADDGVLFTAYVWLCGVCLANWNDVFCMHVSIIQQQMRKSIIKKSIVFRPDFECYI